MSKTDQGSALAGEKISQCPLHGLCSILPPMGYAWQEPVCAQCWDRLSPTPGSLQEPHLPAGWALAGSLKGCRGSCGSTWPHTGQGVVLLKQSAAWGCGHLAAEILHWRLLLGHGRIGRFPLTHVFKGVRRPVWQGGVCPGNTPASLSGEGGGLLGAQVLPSSAPDL